MEQFPCTKEEFKKQFKTAIDQGNFDQARTLMKTALQKESSQEKVAQEDLCTNLERIETTPAIHLAILSPKALMQFLCKDQGNIDILDHDGNTTLHKAAGAGNAKSVNILLRHGAKPNIPNQEGFSALHLASRAGMETTTKVLLMHGADPNQTNPERCYYTPLHCAVEGYHFLARKQILDIASLLIKYGAKAFTSSGFISPFQLAKACGPENIVALLLENECKYLAKHPDDEQRLATLKDTLHITDADVAKIKEAGKIIEQEPAQKPLQEEELPEEEHGLRYITL